MKNTFTELGRVWVLCILSSFLTLTSYAQCPPTGVGYTSIPYHTGFESGIDQFWQTFTAGGSEIDTFPAFLGTAWGSISPVEGTYMLGMHQPNGGTYAQNESWLRLDLCGTSQVRCAFSWAEWNDETEVQDGVFFSDNGGTTFTKVLDLPGAAFTDLTWYQFNLNVDSLCNVHGLNLTSTFVIKFQQYDNFYFNGGNDGHFYDSISVYSEIVADTTVGVAALLIPDSACGNTSDTLRIIVQNYGDSTISNIPVEYSINNGAYMSAGSVPGPLVTGQADTLLLTGLPFATPGTYGVKARTVLVGDSVTTDDMDSATVINNPVPAAPSVTGTDTVCLGGSISLQASGGMGTSFDWYVHSTGNSVASGATFTATPTSPASTVYGVVASFSTGCESDTTLVPTRVDSAFPVVIAPSDSVGLCPGDTFTFDAGAGYTQYLWNGAIIGSSTFEASLPGQYNVRVLDANGCIGESDNVTLFTHPAASVPTISASPSDTVCQGDTITLTSDLSGTLVWSDPAMSTSQSIEVTSFGIYRVTYTDANNCSAESAPVWIGFNPLPVVSISALFPTEFCVGDTIDLTTLGTPAGGMWSGTDVVGDSILPTSAGTATLSYTYTDGNGCSASEDRSVPVIDCISSVAELPAGMEIRVWPIPARDALHITFDLQQETGSYVVYDLRGQEVARGEGLQGAGQRTLSVGSLRSGVYLIRFQGGTFEQTIRWMKE